jgi:Family of unknown function (DUF6326)
MSSTNERAGALEDMHVPVKLKLAASWAALMFLYAYGDVFAYFRPGFIEDVMAGEVFAFEINQVFLVAISIYVAIPAAMVFLSLVLQPRVNRWANIVLGAAYGVTILLSNIGEDYVYYVFLSVVEVAFAALVVWYAWKWPRRSLPSVELGPSAADV